MSERDRNNGGDMHRAIFGHHDAEIWRSKESPINNQRTGSVWYSGEGPRRRGRAAVSSGGFRHKPVLSSSMVTGERPGSFIFQLATS